MNKQKTQLRGITGEQRTELAQRREELFVKMITGDAEEAAAAERELDRLWETEGARGQLKRVD